MIYRLIKNCMLTFQCWDDRDGRKAMSKSNAKGLTTLRQKLKRYIRDQKFEDNMQAFRDVRIYVQFACGSCMFFVFHKKVGVGKNAFKHIFFSI